MKKYLFFVLISTTIYSQDLQNNKNLDSLADIFSLEEVTVNALRAQRDTPNGREKMFLAHKFELDNLNVNYDIIEGSDFNKRLRQAVDYIKKSINFD